MLVLVCHLDLDTTLRLWPLNIPYMWSASPPSTAFTPALALSCPVHLLNSPCSPRNHMHLSPPQSALTDHPGLPADTCAGMQAPQ